MTDDNALTKEKERDGFTQEEWDNESLRWFVSNDVALAVKRLKEKSFDKLFQDINAVYARDFLKIIDECFPVFKEEKKEELSKDD